ncbi:MAG TPA: hypothetical protein VMU32_02320 [Solirubrobacteraceae bacterium]|nr:hypothetical protein [Solirubrobacteraceae bacterium]
MSKVKLTIGMFIAVLAVGAVASASASAAGWMMEGAELTGTASLNNVAPKLLPAELTASGVTIKCKGNLEGVEPRIFGSNKGSAASLIFKECESTTKACELTAAEKTGIGTVPVLAEATLEGTSNVSIAFKPKTGSIFATIKYEAGSEGTCALLGLKGVTGKVTAKSPGGKMESLEHTLEVGVTAESGELKVGSAGASLSGAAMLKLEESVNWSFL